MLYEIKSDVFRENTIRFHNGLNIVLGDESGSNSVGKSNLLLIVDFAFGGDAYLTHSVDVHKELGHHSFYFIFIFDNEKYVFKRTTDDKKKVFAYDSTNNLFKSISIVDYLSFLKDKYDLNEVDNTFRAIVSPFLRIWGRDNYDLKKPLKTHKRDSKEANGVENLLKLFGEYEKIKDVNDAIKKDEGIKKTIDGMYKNNISLKISKSQLKKNEAEIESIAKEIEDIKENILKYVVNVDELINKEVLTLKKKKDKLLADKFNFEVQLRRLQNNLDNETKVTVKQIDRLKLFFPNADIKKIEEIERFHLRLKSILSKEIKERETLLKNGIAVLDEEINLMSKELESYVDSKTPKKIIEKVYGLINNLNDLKGTNVIYLKKENISANLKLLKEQKELLLKDIVDNIQKKITEELLLISNSININANPPKFELSSNKYELQKSEDKGTGSGFMNLLIFDLSVLKLTKLPILIHDSLLFDNISIASIESIIMNYDKINKQIFISIDEHTKYKKIKTILENKKVIKLDRDNVLFTKKWNNKRASQ